MREKDRKKFLETIENLAIENKRLKKQVELLEGEDWKLRKAIEEVKEVLKKV